MPRGGYRLKFTAWSGILNGKSVLNPSKTNHSHFYLRHCLFIGGLDILSYHATKKNVFLVYSKKKDSMPVFSFQKTNHILDI